MTSHVEYDSNKSHKMAADGTATAYSIYWDVRNFSEGNNRHTSGLMYIPERGAVGVAYQEVVGVAYYWIIYYWKRYAPMFMLRSSLLLQEK